MNFNLINYAFTCLAAAVFSLFKLSLPVFIYVFAFLLITRELEDALEMGMDWSLREGNGPSNFL